MFSPSPSDPAIAAAALLDWWRLAGVDHSFRPEAELWLRPAAAEPLQPPSMRTAEAAGDGSVPPTGAEARRATESAIGDPSAWPNDPEGFRSWWLTEPALIEAGAFPRVAPRSVPAPRLMVIVPEPEEVDRDVLLSGPDGATLRGFLRAAGIADADCYLASALPRHTPLVDWATMASRGLGAVLAHHVSLAAPRRVVVFGRRLDALATGFDALIVPGLDELRRSARARERFWRKWLTSTVDDQE